MVQVSLGHLKDKKTSEVGRFPNSRHLTKNSAKFSIAQVALCWLIALLEGALGYAYYTGFLTGIEYLSGHIAVLVGLFVILTMSTNRGRDLNLLSLLLLITLATGPLGAFGCAIMSLALIVKQMSKRRLDDWYSKISGYSEHDPIVDLYENIESGRQPLDENTSPQSFGVILQNGTLVQQQTALGLIARHFNKDFLPVLTMALRSPNAIIRVQAAAVANKLAPRYKKLLWAPLQRN